MLKKAYRINKNWEFQNIYRKGQGFSSQFFNINLIPNKFDFNRFGIVVSKKVARKAVDRNHLKRQVRDIVNELNKKSDSHYDAIVSVKPQSLDTDFNKLKNTLEDLFRKANIIK
jgi:ribonuclease P protein component